MMNLNLGSCDLLLMFIVLMIVPVFKLKTLTISLFFIFIWWWYICDCVWICIVFKLAITSWKDNKSVGYLRLFFDIFYYIFVHIDSLFILKRNLYWDKQRFYLKWTDILLYAFSTVIQRDFCSHALTDCLYAFIHRSFRYGSSVVAVMRASVCSHSSMYHYLSFVWCCHLIYSVLMSEVSILNDWYFRH